MAGTWRKLRSWKFPRGYRPFFPERPKPDEDGLVARGGKFSVPLLVEAYTKGIFPWSGDPPIPWFCPEPRLVLIPSEFHVSKSLRRLERRGTLEVRFDADFRGVMRACATIQRAHEDTTWINENMQEAYGELHDLHIAHSVEAYDGRRLAGGLYGLTLGRALFGESMFSRVSDTSKLALLVLCRELARRHFHFIDCQVPTDHLKRLGAREMPRGEYLRRLRGALRHPSLHESWAGWGTEG